METTGNQLGLKSGPLGTWNFPKGAGGLGSRFWFRA